MIIVGSYFFTWGAALTAVAWQCGQCGTIAPFRLLKGMRWATFFFVIPILPLSSVKHLAECPGCRARYAIQPPPATVGGMRPARGGIHPALLIGAVIVGLLVLCSGGTLALGVWANSAAPRTTAANGSTLYGPASGQLAHRDGVVSYKRANVKVRDFTAEAQFTNPYASDEHRWDYGFLFRSKLLGPEYRLVVFSDRAWVLYHTTDSRNSDDWPLVAQGTIADLNVAANGSNTLRLEVAGSTARFLVNGRYVANLDLSALADPGDVAVAIGLYQDHTVADEQTRFDRFTVWAPGR